MDLRHLIYFVEICKHRSMTKASETLFVSQPTLSRQIADLEKEMGHQLFHRSNHSLHLTSSGKILLKRAIDILDLVNKTKQEFKQLDDFTGGEIHLGLAESIGVKQLATAIRKMKEVYPLTTFHLHSGNYTTVEEKLNKNLLDFALIVQDIKTSDYKFLDIPHHDTWGILKRKDDLQLSNDHLSIADLKTLPLIVSRQGFTDEMPNAIKEIDNQLNIVGTYDLVFNASLFVEEKLGYALTFDKLVNTSDESPLTFVPLQETISSPMKLIWKKDQLLSKSGELFLEFLKRTIRSTH